MLACRSLMASCPRLSALTKKNIICRFKGKDGRYPAYTNLVNQALSDSNEKVIMFGYTGELKYYPDVPFKYLEGKYFIVENLKLFTRVNQTLGSEKIKYFEALCIYIARYIVASEEKISSLERHTEGFDSAIAQRNLKKEIFTILD